MFPWHATKLFHSFRSRHSLTFPKTSTVTSAYTDTWLLSITRGFITFKSPNPESMVVVENPIYTPTPFLPPALTLELILGLLWLSIVSPNWINPFVLVKFTSTLFYLSKKYSPERTSNLRLRKSPSQLNVGLKLKRLGFEKLPVLTAHLLTWRFTAPEIMPGLWKWKLAVRERWLMTAEISHVIGQAFSVTAFLNKTGPWNRG